MGKLLDILLSLKTAFAFFLAGVVLCFIGSLILPANLAFFSGIDDTPLFTWLATEGRLELTWWIHALIVMMGLLALSTVLCTADALLRRMNRRNLALRLSPQLMHLGVLFVMLGHLLTASLGVREDITLRPGEKAELAHGVTVGVRALDVERDEKGYFTDWLAFLMLRTEDTAPREAVLRPARPVYAGGTGLYFKSISMGEAPSALIRVCRDPGALWALAGGILVSVGGLGYLYGRFSGSGPPPSA